jgi:hypothetical protein
LNLPRLQWLHQLRCAVAAPPAVDDFDKAYARTVTAGLVGDIAAGAERFLDQPEIGASRMMEFLSAGMGRLLNAGMPPVANKAHYPALVTTLEQSYFHGGALQTHAVGLEERTPGRDIRSALEQCPTLTLRHTAPDAELGVVVQRVGEALGDHRAAHADLLGAVLGSPPDEQGVGHGLAAGAVLRPPLDPPGTSRCCYTLPMRRGDGHVGLP